MRSEYKVTTTFDDSVSYLSDKESVIDLVNNAVRNEGKKASDFTITKV